MTIHIKASLKTEDKILSELMNVLIKHGFKTEKYLGMTSKIVMARKDESKETGVSK